MIRFRCRARPRDSLVDLSDSLGAARIAGKLGFNILFSPSARPSNIE